ncbi:unnamed protein product, partial [Effrenium voratum]
VIDHALLTATPGDLAGDVEFAGLAEILAHNLNCVPAALEPFREAIVGAWHM